MIFHAEIQNGQLMLSDTQCALRQRLLASMKNGCRVRETITKEGTAKTHQQVKAHFGLVVETVRQRLIDMGCSICGVAPNKEMVHQILKRACGGVGELGESLGLSEMNTTQASQFFSNCRDWAAVELQLVVPEPNICWKEKKIVDNPNWRQKVEQ